MPTKVLFLHRIGAENISRLIIGSPFLPRVSKMLSVGEGWAENVHCLHVSVYVGSLKIIIIQKKLGLC